MPSQIEQADNVNTSQIEMIDERGNKVVVDSNQLAQRQEKVPDGINIPGLGKVGPNSNKPKQPPVNRGNVASNQGRPQQPQQPQQPLPQYQQPHAVNMHNQNSNYNPNNTVPQNTVPQNIQQQPQQPQYTQPQYTQPQPVPVQSNTTHSPFTEIAMTEDEYHIYIDLPGVNKDSLNTSFNAGILSISGNRVSNIEKLRKEKKGTRRKKEPILNEHITVPSFLINKFKFDYPFQKSVDESKITAKLEDGILHITLPHRVKGEEVSIPIM